MMSLAQALEAMERKDERKRPVPFDLTVVTADRKKQTGGELLELKGCVMRRSGRLDHEATSETLAEGESASNEGSVVMRQPNHWKNKTRNVELPNGEIRKVHIRLITRFNGTRVL